MEALEEIDSSEKKSFLERISHFCHVVYRVLLGRRFAAQS